jgi:hypothetical protein
MNSAGRCQNSISVLLVIFNRPAAVASSIKAISQARPRTLYIAADGPRDAVEGARVLCRHARRLALECVDWDCVVKTDFLESNVGCRRRMASAVTWALNNEDRIIIVEDDCVPSSTFFEFCSCMLARYADEPRIMHVSGHRRIRKPTQPKVDYFFSRYGSVWGWATWRRAWELHDARMTDWPAVRDSDLLTKVCMTRQEAILKRDRLDAVFHDELDTWDYGWLFTIQRHRGLCIVPACNLVRNTGFGLTATHTRNPLAMERFRRSHNLLPPYVGPVEIQPFDRYDRKCVHFSTHSYFALLARLFRHTRIKRPSLETLF